jgi:hypothetical protein
MSRSDQDWKYCRGVEIFIIQKLVLCFGNVECPGVVKRQSCHSQQIKNWRIDLYIVTQDRSYSGFNGEIEMRLC